MEAIWIVPVIFQRNIRFLIGFSENLVFGASFRMWPEHKTAAIVWADQTFLRLLGLFLWALPITSTVLCMRRTQQPPLTLRADKKTKTKWNEHIAELHTLAAVRTYYSHKAYPDIIHKIYNTTPFSFVLLCLKKTEHMKLKCSTSLRCTQSLINCPPLQIVSLRAELTKALAKTMRNGFNSLDQWGGSVWVKDDRWGHGQVLDEPRICQQRAQKHKTAAAKANRQR